MHLYINLKGVDIVIVVFSFSTHYIVNIKMIDELKGEVHKVQAL
jgi:hypothetical protein